MFVGWLISHGHQFLLLHFSTLKSSKDLYADSDLPFHATAVSFLIEQKYTGKLNRVLRVWGKKIRRVVWLTGMYKLFSCVVAWAGI